LLVADQQKSMFCAGELGVDLACQGLILYIEDKEFITVHTN